MHVALLCKLLDITPMQDLLLNKEKGDNDCQYSAPTQLNMCIDIIYVTKHFFFLQKCRII